MSETKNSPIASPGSPKDREPSTVGTPEGDNEYPPDAPLKPTSDGLQVPAGSGPLPDESDQAQADKPEQDKPTGIIKFIDEVARGEFM